MRLMHHAKYCLPLLVVFGLGCSESEEPASSEPRAEVTTAAPTASSVVAPAVEEVETAPAVEEPAEPPPEPETPRILVDGKWPAREVSAGRPLKRSALENAPGYHPPDDPEADAVVRGYRIVGPNDLPLTEGRPSAESLARAILSYLNTGDMKGLNDLRITYDEFRDILWPEFPQSRPVTNIRANHAYDNLWRTCASGINRGLTEWDHAGLEFESLSIDGGYTPYPNFRLFREVRIIARTPAEQLVRVSFAHTWAEKDGVWKVYLYED